MPRGFGIALKITWGSLLLFWLWSGRRLKAPMRVESRLKRFALYWLPVAVTVALLGPGAWYGHTVLHEEFITHSLLVESIGLGLCVAGAALACWARHLLGANWSFAVQRKRGHELIQAGPYGVIRHPIYTGLLMAFLGDAVMIGEWRGLLAIGIFAASLWHKMNVEERWLLQHFGDSYREYRRRTKALVPGP